jgi:hypothetical protein
MSPVQTATREKRGERAALIRPYAPADFLLAPPKDILREIVVDWQLPADMEQERR